MTNEEITKILSERYAETLKIEDVRTNIPTARIERDHLLATCQKLKADPILKLNHLIFLSAIDYPPDRMDVTYLLNNFDTGYKILLKSSVPREKPEIESVTSIWPGANWHEREAFDLFGITFHHHPDMRRIFCDGVTEGHPLRKDYTDDDFVKMPEPTIILPAPAARAAAPPPTQAPPAKEPPKNE